MLSPTTLLARSADLAATRLRGWAVDSQQRARRNAMLAATDCAQRRAEREDVADYLARRAEGSDRAAHALAPHDRVAGASG